MQLLLSERCGVHLSTLTTTKLSHLNGVRSTCLACTAHAVHEQYMPSLYLSYHSGVTLLLSSQHLIVA